jgi:hypothetical protein
MGKNVPGGKMSKDGWDKFEIIGKAVAGLVLGAAAFWVNYSLQERTLQQKYIEIAVSVLRAEPLKDRGDGPVREWASDILKAYSPVPLTDAALKSLREHALPSSQAVLLSGTGARAEAGQLSVSTASDSKQGAPSGVGARAEAGSLSVGVSPGK